MKRVVLTLTTVAAMAMAVAVSAPVIQGRGLVDFVSHGHGEGRASFEVSVQQNGKRLTGRFLFSAEGIHIDQPEALTPGDGYPDLVVTAESIGSTQIKGNVATLRTKAVLHQEPVMIMVMLTDSRSKSVSDRFHIRCDRPDGTHLFHVEGPLTSGDISIR